MDTLINQMPEFSRRCQNLPSSFIRDILKITGQKDIISFAGGLPDPELFPLKEIEGSTAAVFKKEGAKLLQYSQSEGIPILKDWICKYYDEKYQLKICPEQVLITNGSQQALDLIGKAFINPGDQIVLEQPSYLGAIQAFMAYEPAILPVAIHKDGIDIQALEALLILHQPKLLYLVSNFQNPSGFTLSLEKREQLTALAVAYGFIIIEDDPYGQLRYEGEHLPPMLAFCQNSILCGSFSKVVAPGLRIGWVVAQEAIIQKLLVLKQASDLHSNNLSQYITEHFLSNYNLDNHLDKLRASYGEKCQYMFDILKRALPAECRISKPEGGMFLWVEIPEFMDAEELLRETIQQRVLFVPGKYFFTNGKGHNTMRLNFTNSSKQQIETGVLVIAEVMEKMLVRN